LQTKLKNTNDELQELQDKKADCVVKLDRAEQLISSLGSEKARWTQKETELGID